MTELAIAGLAKTLGARAVLRGLELTVESGGLLAILGASGSGKTTLLRCICGFERVDEGSIRIGGAIVAGGKTHVPPERRRVGYVAQEGALFPHLNVADNIAFGLPRRLRRERRRVDELLELVGLPRSYAARGPQQLSGGEQQRVALARALAPDPALVLLDEPFSSLDAALRAGTREAVTAALANAGATALLVTHDQAEALSIGRRVAVLRDGRLIQIATPEILYRQPVDAELARFVGEAVLLTGLASGGRVSCALGDLKLCAPAPDGPVEAMIRPEQIRLRSVGDATEARAEVVAVTFYGPDAEVRLSLSGAEPALAFSARVPGYACPRPGDSVAIAVVGEVVAYPRPEGGVEAGSVASQAPSPLPELIATTP
ncbi:MAG: ABC transporter ATP-binding protein [Roseiarcus sp.]|uniref:ABC transporter ATP-binding protein n=1 Tax=Roseiarcus sp. TaxID=1969460 RepID=UPI003BB1D457